MTRRAGFAGFAGLTGVAVCALVTACSAVTGCGNRHRENREPPRDARARRVIEPSTDRVGPLPPYAIRSDGVGPYKLGEKLSDLLEQLPSGPQIVLFEIPGVVHRNVIRAEDDTVLIGGEQSSTATFVAVVGADVARTEGVHVGSSKDELITGLGPPVDDPERAHDPRLIAPSALPNLRIVLDANRIAAIVVTSAAARSRTVTDCPRPASTENGIGACLTAAGELIEINGDEVAIRNADGDRTIATVPKLTGLVFAAPLRSAAEARDELVAITRSDEATTRTWWISGYRLEGTRLIRTIDATQIYQLSSANARWIGTDLRDVEIYLELNSRPDGVDVGGLLTTRSSARGKTIADVVVIAPAQVTRRRGKPVVTEANDAGVAAGPPLPPPSAPASSSASSSRAAQDAAIDAGEAGASDSEPDRR